MFLVSTARIATTCQIESNDPDQDDPTRDEVYRMVLGSAMPSLPWEFVEQHIPEMEQAAQETSAEIRYDTIFNSPLKKLRRSIYEHLAPETLDAAWEEISERVLDALPELLKTQEN